MTFSRMSIWSCRSSLLIMLKHRPVPGFSRPDLEILSKKLRHSTCHQRVNAAKKRGRARCCQGRTRFYNDVPGGGPKIEDYRTWAGASGGTADARDLKSCPGNRVGVRFPPSPSFSSESGGGAECTGSPGDGPGDPL